MKLKWFDVLSALGNGGSFSRNEIAATAVEAKACIDKLISTSELMARINTLEEILFKKGIDSSSGEFLKWYPLEKLEETPPITKLFKRVSEAVYEALGTTYGCHLHLLSGQITITVYLYDHPSREGIPICNYEDPRTVRHHCESSTTTRSVTGFTPDLWNAEDFERFEKKCLAEFLR